MQYLQEANIRNNNKKTAATNRKNGPWQRVTSCAMHSRLSKPITWPFLHGCALAKFWQTPSHGDQITSGWGAGAPAGSGASCGRKRK